MRARAVSHPHRQLPSMPATTAPEGDVRHSDAVSSRFAGGRPPTVRELAESRYCREHRSAHPAVEGVARYDAKPATGTLARVPFLFVTHRKRTDDAQPRHA